MYLKVPHDDKGLLRGNPKACSTNFFKLSECPCIDVPRCLYTYTGTDVSEGDTLTGVLLGESTHNGEVYPSELVTINPSPTDVSAYSGSFAEIIKKYVTAVNVFTTFDDAGNFVFEYIGAKEVKELHFGDTIIVLEKMCDVREVCTYQILASETIPSLNGVEDLSTNPYPYDPADAATNVATAAILDADVEAALTAQGIPFTNVTVTPDASNEMYLIEVQSDGDFAGNTLGSKVFECCGCEQEYYSA